MKSNLKTEARERQNAHGFERCPYHEVLDLRTLAQRFDDFKREYPDKVAAVLETRSDMLQNVVLMHALWGPMDKMLEVKQESLKRMIGELKERVKPESLAFDLRIMMARAVFAVTANWAKAQIEALGEAPQSDAAIKFMNFFNQTIADHEITNPILWRQVFSDLYDLLLKSEPEAFSDWSVIHEIYWHYLAKALKTDLADGVLTKEDFANFDALEDKFSLLHIEKEEVCASKFLKLLDEPM